MQAETRKSEKVEEKANPKPRTPIFLQANIWKACLERISARNQIYTKIHTKISVYMSTVFSPHLTCLTYRFLKDKFLRFRIYFSLCSFSSPALSTLFPSPHTSSDLHGLCGSPPSNPLSRPKKPPEIPRLLAHLESRERVRQKTEVSRTARL